MEPIRKILSDRNGPLTLSPAGDIYRPEVMLFSDADAYRRLFSGVLVKRSPARVGRRGLFQEFLNRACLQKLEDDVRRGFDVSVVPYPLKLDLRAWGVALDPVGRIWGVRTTDADMLEMEFHGGCCRSKDDWECLVGEKAPDETDPVLRFYNRARLLGGKRVILAGTVGFGLWDALWMSFDFDRACDLLAEDEDFAVKVFSFWKSRHVAAVTAMLDAGVKLIMFREHPAGFPASRGMAERLDPYLRDNFQELSRTVHARGACVFLDCDAEDIFETDFPLEWGFDGIGPLLFRDDGDLQAARRCMARDLFLVGTMASPPSCPSLAREIGSTRRVMITNELNAFEEAMVDPSDGSNTCWSSNLPESVNLAS
ncbi:MAG: hypothetical protein HY914_13035 [Desulfomonile tiedjei]|nr:hypothetical protein [Desulfomonile tiedjei]